MKGRRCGRCGAELPDLAHVAALALRADKALQTMRLVVPSEVTEGVRKVSRALRCYAGLCAPERTQP